MPTFSTFGVLFLPDQLAILGSGLRAKGMHVVVEGSKKHANTECNEAVKIKRKLEMPSHQCKVKVKWPEYRHTFIIMPHVISNNYT